MTTDGTEYAATSTIEVKLGRKTYSCEIGRKKDGPYVEILSVTVPSTMKPEQISDDVRCRLLQLLSSDELHLLVTARLYPGDEHRMELARKNVITRREESRRYVVMWVLVALGFGFLFLFEDKLLRLLAESLLFPLIFAVAFYAYFFYWVNDISIKAGFRARHKACGEFGHVFVPRGQIKGRYCTRCHLQLEE